MAAVGAQAFTDACRIDRRGAPKIDRLDLQAEPMCHLRPTAPESAGQGHEHAITARVGVRERYLPGGVPVSDIHRDLMLGARDSLEIRRERLGHLDKRPGIDVRRGPVHRAQYALRNDRRAGNGEGLGTVCEGHRGGAFESEGNWWIQTELSHDAG